MPSIKQRIAAYNKELERIRLEAIKYDDKSFVGFVSEIDKFRDVIAKVILGDYTYSNKLIKMIKNEVGRFESRLVTLSGKLTIGMVSRAKLMVVNPITAAGLSFSEYILPLSDYIALGKPMINYIKEVTRNSYNEIMDRVKGQALGNLTMKDNSIWLENFISSVQDRDDKRFGSLPYQVERIARTESMKVLNNSHQLMLEKTVQNGPEWAKGAIRKYWKHGIRGRKEPRQHHIEQERKTKKNPIPVEAKFRLSTGYECIGPHDPVLPAEEVIFCACTISTTIDLNSLQREL